MQPVRLAIARAACRYLPPLAAVRAGDLIYSMDRASRDDYTFITRARTGARFTHNTSDFHAHRFAVHGFHEWRHWAIALALGGSGTTIVEVGANVGTETVGFADIVGRSGAVYAFEPLPTNVEALHRNLKLNDYDHVHVLPFAVGERCETVRFSPPPTRGLSGIGYVVGDPADDSDSIELECVTLDSLAERINHPSMIFIDAEGSEIAVLRGARRLIDQTRPAIVLEASPKNLARSGFDTTTLYEQIRSFDYDVFGINRFGLRAIDEDALEIPLANWLCIHSTRRDDVDRAKRSLRACGFLPCVAGLNPLARRHRRQR